MQPFPALVGASYRSQSLQADGEDLINWYTERSESPGADAPEVLYPTPGVRALCRLPTVGGRGSFSEAASGGRCFQLNGTKLFELFQDGTFLDRGDVEINDDPGQITSNGDAGNQLLIVSGGNGYYYDLTTNVLIEIATMVGKATQCGYAYGYGLIFDRLTSTVFQSDLFDFSVFDPLNFFQRNIGSDDWISMQVLSWGQIALIGTKTRDTYYNAGTFPIPFAPAQSGLQTQGSAATFAIGESDGKLVWLGTSAQGGYVVYAAEGYAAARVSDHGVESAIADYARRGRIDNARMDTYTDRGHPFTVLTFPTADRTWVLDGSTGRWHERSTLRPDGTNGRWRSSFHCFAFNKHLWSDPETGGIFETDISFVRDVDGQVIRRQRTTPTICRGLQVLDFGRLELLAQVGIGNASLPATDPQIVLQYSDDGGMTWSPEFMASLGRIGDYLIQVAWEQLGSARKRTYRFVTSDPVRNLCIVAGYHDVSDERGRSVPLGRAT